MVPITMQPDLKLSFIDRLRLMRETRFGAFVPVLLALAAIWIYFGVAVPLWEYWADTDAESIRFIFLSPRNIYNLFMQSAVIATLAVGITVVLLLGDIDLSAAATAGVCAALLGVFGPGRSARTNCMLNSDGCWYYYGDSARYTGGLRWYTVVCSDSRWITWLSRAYAKNPTHWKFKCW